MANNKLPTFTNAYNSEDSIIDLLMNESSCLMYEFKDTTIQKTLLSGQVATKSISPLFSTEIIDADYNQQLLSIITSNIPYYFSEPTSEVDASSKYFLSQSRDPHILYVPSAIQNSFWNVYLGETLGDIDNNILLTVYNQLQFPFINENQYLNAELFPKLANIAYSLKESTTDDIYDKKIEFKYAEEDNLADIEAGDLGCIDYLNDIVDSKLSSTYAMIDYNPDQSVLLSDWCDSLYLSGRLPYSEISKEKSIFKLQDLNYELLRRKFAGSSTLYKLSLASVDRQGSFIGLITAGKLNIETNDGVAVKSFRDKRLIRTINLPGLLSSIVDMSDTNPLKVYYDIPYEEDETYIPLSTATPLFYTSGLQTSTSTGGGVEEYDAESFYIGNIDSPVSLTKYRSYFLRDNSSVIPWDTPTGITSSNTIRSTYPKLDELDPYEEGLYRRMDHSYDTPGEFPTHYDIIALDIKTPLLSSSSSSGSCLDINTNRILYHKNTIQSNLGDLYPYVTYPIANNNSLSLMDTPWMDYMKSSTERKSRVQDNVLFGAQVSHYVNLSGEQTAEYNFFGISYSIDDDISVLYTYDEIINHPNNPNHLGPRFAYIWLVTIYYYPYTKIIKEVTPTLVTKIALQLTSSEATSGVSGYSKAQLNRLKKDYADSSSFNELLQYSRGCLPFTYSNLIGSVLAGTQFGIYSDGTSLKFIDDLENSIYEKCTYIFSENDTIPNIENAFTSINGIDNNNIDPSSTPPGLQRLPTAKTKGVYYIVSRYEPVEDGSSELEKKFKWSEVIKVLPINTTLIKYLEKETPIDSDFPNSEFTPDWYQMGYHLNPYLNFTKNCASTLRYKSSPPSLASQSIDITTEALKELLKGPSNFISLANLACTRHQDYLRNDDGATVQFEGALPPIIGSYLERIAFDKNNPIYSIYNREYVRLYGDNRIQDLYDLTDSSEESLDVTNRSDIAVDSFSLYSINLKKGNPDDDPPRLYPDISPNILKLQPFNFKKYLGEDSTIYVDEEHTQPLSHTLRDIYHNWWLNKPSDGFSICFNLRFSSDIITSTIIEDEIVLASRYDDTVDGTRYDFKFYLQRNPDDKDEWCFVYEMFPVGTPDFSFKVESRYYTEFELTGYQLIQGNNSTELSETRAAGNYRLAASSYAQSVEKGFSKTDVKSVLNISLIINDEVYYKDYKVNYDENDNIEVYELQNKTYVKSDSISEALTSALNASNYVVRDDFTYISNKDYYLPIYPVKFNKEDVNNHLGSITFLSDYTFDEDGNYVQKNAFFGNLYDIRIYNKGFNPYSLKVISAGTVRELYSYAPSLYKLGYSIYKDLGIFKIKNKITGSIPSVKTVRIFNRSVWDSMLLDMYPVSEEEMDTDSPQYTSDYYNPQDDPDIYVNGESKAVTQDLINPAEVINENSSMNSGTSTLVINYKGENHYIYEYDNISAVVTMLYPVDYKNHKFSGGAKLVVKSEDDTSEFTTGISTIPVDDEYVKGTHIKIPARATGNTLKYYGDLGLNFKISSESDFSTFYSRGTNIDLVYSEALSRSVISLKDPSIRSSDSNHVLSYFTVPRRDDLSAAVNGYLDRLYISNVQLASAFNILLSADSYYNELEIPVATQFDLTKDVKVTPRWHAIRTLKEGTYFITCKYPLQINPFMDYDYNISLTSKYLTVYGTVRFKIEVTGEEISYDSDTYKIDGYPSWILKSNIKNEVSSGRALYNSTDNRTFPHRRINIRFYVMDCESGYAGMMTTLPDGSSQETYTFKWELLASNVPEDNVILLNPDNMLHTLIIDKDIPLFFSKNYMTPFFIAKYTKGGLPDPTSADDDLISPIMIIPYYNETALQEENLVIQSESDMDNMKIIAGKSYKVLLDYTGKITEFSYTDTVFESSNIGDEEKTVYNRMFNLLDSQGDQTEYMYSSFAPWYNIQDTNITATTSGFDIDENGWINIGRVNKNYYLGNPYSRSSDNNYLLKTVSSYRKNINNLASFPYVCKDFYEKSFLPATYIKDLPVVESTNGVGVYTLSKLADFNELTLIRDLVSNLCSTISSTISKLTTKSFGVFSNLSTFKPNILYDELASTNKKLYYDYVKSTSYDLYVFSAADRYISIKNPQVLLSRRGLYSNNLITNQMFDDKSAYYMSVVGKYVPDSDWDNNQGKDVYCFTLSSTTPENTIDYISSLGYSRIKAQFETAINLKCSDIQNIKVYADYMLQNKVIKEIEMTSITKGQLLNTRAVQDLENNTWYVYSHDIDEAIEIDAIRYRIVYTGNSTCNVYLTKLVLRKSSSINHYLGLSDVVYNVSSSDSSARVLTYSHSIPLFKNVNDSTIIPIRFLNNIKSYNSSNDYGNINTAHYVDSGLKRMADFINTYNIDNTTNNNSRMTKMLKPWIRRLQYWEAYETSNSQTITTSSESETVTEKVIEPNKVAFYNYRVAIDSNNMKSAQQLKTPINDIFIAENKQVEDPETHEITTVYALDYDDETSEIKINSLKVLVNDSYLKEFKTNLEINLEDPITFENESFTLLSNCFNPERYNKGLSTAVAVTNIQLLSAKADEDKYAKILYEYEYIPIIYDELEHHLSLNLFIHQSTT